MGIGKIRIAAFAAGGTQGITAEYLLAAKGYDSDALVESLRQAGVHPVIPPSRSRTGLLPHDKYPYRLRHGIENAFLELKRWRGIATRNAKNSASFLAVVHIISDNRYLG